MKKQLTLIDYQLNQFAKSKNGEIGRDETKGMWLPKEFESRSISWKKNKMNYGLGIYPEIDSNEKITKWTFSYNCWYDTKSHRFYKGKTLVSTSKVEDIINNITELLEKAELDLKTWNKEDLPAAVEFSS